MSTARLIPGLGLVMLLGCTLCSAQSLADAARQNRQQKEARGTTAKKIYTSDNMTGLAPADPKDLSGTWSFTHLDNRFEGWVELRQSGTTLEGTWHTSSGKSEPDTSVTGTVNGTTVMLTRFLGSNQQNYALTLSPDGTRLDGFGEGYFLHHSNLNLKRSGDVKPAIAPPSTTSTSPPPKQ